MTLPASSSRVIIVSGPSGSGKSTLVDRLRDLPNTLFAVSITTRPPRTAESPGKCYDFSTPEEFQRKVEQGEFLEYAQVFGKHWYGTPRKWLDQAQQTGSDLVLEIDVQGAQQVKKKLPNAVAIFIVPPSRELLEQRLRARGQDSSEAIVRRLERARQEMSLSTDYDFVVVNDNLERAGDEVRSIVVASRCRSVDNQERLRKILESFGGH
jgi:guanylate kinase